MRDNTTLLIQHQSYSNQTVSAWYYWLMIFPPPPLAYLWSFRYFQFVLLHAVRDNLAKSPNSQLDPSLCIALKKALVCNPALFMKGLLFPLCESNTCTVAEACILANVLGQTKIPALQSATALLRLSEQLFTLPICILVQVFLQKKQALPYRVVDILTFKYFCQREQQLPFMWYQSLLMFAQRYCHH